MHATQVLQKCLSTVFERMDPRRVSGLLGAVTALLSCRRLVLMELARAWPGAERVRAPLKRLDRLLGNPHLHAEAGGLYAGLVPWLIRSARPVLLIDWSELKSDGSLHVLRAAVPVGGRALTLYEEVYPQSLQGSPRAERQFLRRLARLLPAGVQPVLITDTGFKTPWFRAVRALGWDYVGRVRGHIQVQLGAGPWQPAQQCWALARRYPQAFAVAALTRAAPWSCRLVLQRRRAHGRQMLTQAGSRRRSTLSLRHARGGREPWLLATSLSVSARAVLTLYSQRMQIEDAFRDLKSERFGCGLALRACQDFCVKSHTLPARARKRYGQERQQGFFHRAARPTAGRA